jgi:hypothetical protein
VIEFIDIIGALGGRLDHEMANINTLYRFSDGGGVSSGGGSGACGGGGSCDGCSGGGEGGSACTWRVPTLTLVGEKSAVRLLGAGTTVLTVSAIEGPTCGLLPIGELVTPTFSFFWLHSDFHLFWRVLACSKDRIDGYHAQKGFAWVPRSLEIWPLPHFE